MRKRHECWSRGWNLLHIPKIVSLLLLLTERSNSFELKRNLHSLSRRTSSQLRLSPSASSNKHPRKLKPKKQHHQKRSVEYYGQNHDRYRATSDFNQWLQLRIQAPNPIQLAEDALWERVYSQGSLRYSTISFNIVLNGWAQQRSIYAAQRADQLLHQLLELQQSQPHLQADTYSYSAVLNAYAKSNGRKAAALRAEELLTQMQQSLTTFRTDVCHNAVMDAWSVSEDPQAGERAESILRNLPNPSRISYNSCIKAYARSHAPNQAQRLLEEMRTLSQNSRPELEPDKISISTCIDAWSKWNKNLTHAALQAESLLLQMERDYETEPLPTKQPDIVTYTAVLTAYARAGWPEASEKSLDLIRRMNRYSDEKPNAPFFNTIIHLLAKSKKAHNSASSPDQVAESILRHMKEEFETTQRPDIRPCKITYTAVIAVLAAHYEGGVAAPRRAEELLNELETLYNTTQLELYLPNTKTFGAVLSVWAKAACTSSQGEEEGEEEDILSGDGLWQRAESLLQRMERLYHRTHCEELKPTSILYSQKFRILANGRDPQAATRGLELMKRLKELNERTDDYGDQIRLDSTMYAYLVVTFTKSKVENVVEVATRILQEVEEGYKAGRGNLKPTSLLYSAVLQAYAKSASKEGAQLAEELLEKCKSLYKQGKLYAKPTTLFYNAVIDAQARSNGGLEAAERAEALLQEMEVRGRVGDSELGLTTRSFNAAILAWKNSNAPDAPERAEALLKKMNAKYKAGDEKCRPDRVTVNSIIGVWAKSSQKGAAVRAEQFLQFMEDLHKSGDPIKPDRYSYNTVIDAYSRSPDPGSAQRAQALFERMKALYEAGERDVRPDLITLSSLRKAWMACSDPEAKVYLDRVGNMILVEVEHQRWAKQVRLSNETRCE
jgi:PPR repeat